MDALKKKFEQTQLEGITDHVFETGDTAAYDTAEYHQAKQRLLSLVVGHKQKAATNYNGGGPSGEHR